MAPRQDRLSQDAWEKTKLVDVLESFGQAKPKHYMEPTEEQIKMGEQLVLEGRITDSLGNKTKYISKYFPCTSCHNLVKEDPVISVSDPDARLTYAIENKIPFLQGTTFWGIVNRESWYNDDYYLKYGDAVKQANNSLRTSIQLCAIECSQGRPLDKWEEDAILAYYWSLQLTIGDLDLPDSLSTFFNKMYFARADDKEYLETLRTYYAQKAPATFAKPLEDKVKGYGLKGDPERGAAIYELSCRNCHNESGVSDYLLDYAPYTFQHLKSNMFNKDQFSIYHIIRKGTYATPGARPYMPHYPKEKMSDQQIEDLRAYIEKMCE